MACDCKEPVQPGTALDVVTRGVARRLAKYCSGNACSQSDALDRLEKLGKRSSGTVTARLSNDSLARLKRYAEARHMSPGAVAREAICALAGRSASFMPLDPDLAAKLLKAVAAALGLPSDTPAEVIVDAVSTAASAIAPSEPVEAAPEAALSKTELAFCGKFGVSTTRFLADKQARERREAARRK